MKSLRLAIPLALLLVALVASAPHATAQSGGDYDLTWNTLDGGGALVSTGGAFALSGTIGQMDAGDSSGDSFSLAGGFWFDMIPRLFLPMTAK